MWWTGNIALMGGKITVQNIGARRSGTKSLEDLSTDGKCIESRCFGSMVVGWLVGCVLHSSGAEQELVTYSCELGNEMLVDTKREEFLAAWVLIRYSGTIVPLDFYATQVNFHCTFCFFFSQQFCL